MALQFLVMDGNPREAREKHKAEFGKTTADAYVELIRWLEPSAACVILNGADHGSAEADGDLARFDAVVVTGSQLHVQERSLAVTRQLDLMRAVFRAKVPAFGSCWGMQVAGVAAGGEASRNPQGPEYGFARRLAPTAAGGRHPLLAGRPPAYDAPAIHVDAVVKPPPDCDVLASNRTLSLQAAEIRHEGGVFWGVQYHPELDLAELSLMLRVMAGEVVAEGLCRSEADVRAYAEDLRALHANPDRADLAWRYGLDAEVLDPVRRTREIRNFIDHCVKPTKSAHGHA
jgi:GMP synthase (glutamine-hydrolysing)